MSDQTIFTSLHIDDVLRVASAQPEAWERRAAIQSNSVPRAQVRVPIANHSPPTDRHLFVDPTDRNKKYWLPRYQLAEQIVSGQPRYHVGFAEQNGVWILSLQLVTVPPPPLESASRVHPVLPHDLELEFSYSVLGAPSARKTLLFQELIRDKDRVDAALTLSGLSQRDEVFQALSDPTRAAQLVVRRRTRIAVPEQAEVARIPEAGNIRRPIVPHQPIFLQPVRPVQPIRPRPRPPQLATPKLVFAGSERYTVRNTTFIRYRLQVTNWNEYTAGHFKKSPNLPPCGANKNASRSWVDILDARTEKRIYGFCALGKPENLTKLWFAKPANKSPPAKVRIRLTDRLTKTSRLSNSVSVRSAPPSEPRFREIKASIDHIADPQPFLFSTHLHGYIFDAIDGVGHPPEDGLIRHRESFEGRVHSYFQDAAEPNIIYHLPDDFRIARRVGVERPPFMTLRVRSQGGSTRNTEVTLDVVIAPVTDPARLDAARVALAARTGIGPNQLLLQPYITSNVRFLVQRPTSDGRFDEERPGGALMLQGPLFDTLTMSLVDFQLAFDAMLGRTAALFGGRVEIDIEGWDTEVLPFFADLTRMAGRLFDLSATETPEGLSIVLSNAIESPVLLSGLLFEAVRGGVRTHLQPHDPGQAEGELAAGDQREIRTPRPDLPGSGPIQISVREGVRIRPDDQAVLDAILDRTTLQYFRDIMVHALSSMFEPIPDRPNDQIHAILVEFEGGETVSLTADALEATARIDYSFEDVILRADVDFDDQYRYTKTVIRVDGRHQRDLEPLANRSTILFVSVIK